MQVVHDWVPRCVGSGSVVEPSQGEGRETKKRLANKIDTNK